MKIYPEVGVCSPNFYIPKPSIDYSKWAVIACDQFTSEPAYWQQVRQYIGNAPSTYHLILPEAYLGTELESEHLINTSVKMREYYEKDYLIPKQGMVYVERTFGNKIRKGLILALDLEQYDFQPDSTSIIRTSEKTIIERLPPRIEIRKNALFEIPHILVLIDDRPQCIIENLAVEKERFEKIYDFDLMLGSGHVKGYLIKNELTEQRIISGLKSLINKDFFSKKYNLPFESQPILFAIGDGNHSLATAKSIWEEMKNNVSENHPARYALVEVENIHDQGLFFEPIHRILFGIKRNIEELIHEYFHVISQSVTKDHLGLINEVKNSRSSNHVFGCIHKGKNFVFEILNFDSKLCVSCLQTFLDTLVENGQAESIDYIHGEDVIYKLIKNTSNIGFILPPLQKEDFFSTIITEGVLPKKTFSMGNAKQKRFYFECRKIK